MLMVMMHGEDDADEHDDDTDDDDDDDDDAFVAYLIWTLVLMLGDLHSGTLFFDPRFRGDPVHLLLHLRVTSVFFFLLFLRISPINNNNHHHNVYIVPRILKTTFNTTSTLKAHWGSAASGVSLLNTMLYHIYIIHQVNNGMVEAHSYIYIYNTYHLYILYKFESLHM